MNKLYYSISEICSIIDEEQHILRYWEKEFEGFKPKKNRRGYRIYTEKDLNMIKVIKILLRNEMLSLNGAKEQFKKILKSDIIDFLNNYDKTETKAFNITGSETNQKNLNKKRLESEDLEYLKQTLLETLNYLQSR